MNKAKLFDMVSLTMIIGLCLFPFSTYAHDADPIPQALSYAWLKKELHVRASNLVVDDLYRQNEYDEVMDEIKSGKSAWIALSPQLAAGAESRASVSSNDIASVTLSLALAVALPINPRAVLSILDSKTSTRTLTPEAVCSAPFGMNWGREYSDYVNRSIKAVEKADSHNPEAYTASCLSELKKIAKTIDTKDYN